MSKQAAVRWDNQRGRWFCFLKWQGKRLYYSSYMGIPTGIDKKTPCPIAAKIAEMINSDIDRKIFNPARYKKQKPFHLDQYFKKWISSINIEDATRKDYKNSFENHIIPVIGSAYIGDINFEILRDLQNGIKRTNKGKKNVMGALHKLLRDAKRSGHIPVMPEFPGFTGKDAIEEKAPEWIDCQTQEMVIAEIPSQDRYIFEFMRLTGCRVSEARAFRWQDIRKRHIIFAVTFGPKEDLKTIKNKKQGKFPMTEGLSLLLESVPRNLTNFVFLNSRTGKPYTKNINRDFWNPACKKTGVNIQLNNFGRHSFANQLLEETDNISVVSKALRHSNIGITKKHYGDHSIESMRRIIDNVKEFKK